MSGEGAAASAGCWARLGIEPTEDPSEVRRAYARALKQIDPAQDPDAFQALREALDTALAGLQAPPADDSAVREPVAAFLAELLALRNAGDTAGAIALVDRLFAGQPAASPLLRVAGAELFNTVALAKRLSPALFRHLVDRFEWRDAAGPEARADPQRHSVLLARVAAEDWYAALVAAARPGSVAAALLAHPPGPAGLPELNKDGKDEARAAMAELLRWEQFVLARFDARSLAVVREAVEGPPLVAGAFAPVPPAPAASAPARRRLSRRASLALTAAGALAASASLVDWRAWLEDPPSAQSQARSVLDQTSGSWVFLRPFDGSVLVYFTQIVTCRAALQAVRYGLDRNVPDRDFPLPPNQNAWPQLIGQDPVYVRAPASLRFVSVVLTYADESTSPVRIYHLGEAS